MAVLRCKQNLNKSDKGKKQDCNSSQQLRASLKTLFLKEFLFFKENKLISLKKTVFPN
jgi:hypothetical protein